MIGHNYSQCVGEELKGTLYQEIKVGRNYFEKTTGTFKLGKQLGINISLTIFGKDIFMGLKMV